MGTWVVFLGFWGSSGFFLFLSCFFFSFLLLGGLGDFPWVWGLFLSLVVFLCLFLLVPFLLLGSSCSFLVPFFVSSCSFSSCFEGPGWFSCGLGFFLFLSCLFFLFIFFLLGGPGWFSWGLGFFLFLSCFFLFLFFLFWGPGWFSWVWGVLLVPFLFLLEEEDEEKEKRQDLWFWGSSCSFLVSSRRR